MFEKPFIFLFIFVLAVSFFGCVENKTADSIIWEADIDHDGLADKTPMTLPEYPVIDGSSSTESMHAAIRSYLTGEDSSPGHSQTYAA
ncbi:MAG: hypothetical protein LBS19_09010, partial [Clostridiales bacterium]|nr:hypothetical protein [Clostridiales bacterium]